MTTSTPDDSVQTVRLTPQMTWQEISAAMRSVPTSEFQQFFIHVRSAYAKRLDDDRRRSWASQGMAKLTIDSAKERT